MDDPQTVAQFPTPDHRCTVGNTNLTITWQKTYCLGEGHTRCVYFQRASAVADPVQVPPARKSVRAPAIAVVAILLVLAAVAGLRVAPAPDEPGPRSGLVAAAPTSTATESVIATHTSPAVQQLVPLETATSASTVTTVPTSMPRPSATLAAPTPRPNPTLMPTVLATPTPLSTETPTPQPTETPTPSPTSIEYVVVAGDTIYSIAAKFGVTTLEVIAVNDLLNPDDIRPGQVLLVPVQN